MHTMYKVRMYTGRQNKILFIVLPFVMMHALLVICQSRLDACGQSCVVMDATWATAVDYENNMGGQSVPPSAIPALTITREKSNKSKRSGKRWRKCWLRFRPMTLSHVFVCVTILRDDFAIAFPDFVARGLIAFTLHGKPCNCKGLPTKLCETNCQTMPK